MLGPKKKSRSSKSLDNQKGQIIKKARYTKSIDNRGPNNVHNHGLTIVYLNSVSLHDGINTVSNGINLVLETLFCRILFYNFNFGFGQWIPYVSAALVKIA